MRLLYKSGPMESLRKWFYKPKRDDRSLLAQFFFADDALNVVAAELDSFDGRKDPERCSTLVNQLRHAQDRVLNITSQIMDQILGDERVARGFRVKFPEDVLQDNLAGQLWFGAECLAAGSSIMNREEESAAMRPLAKALTRSLETVRSLLREQCLRPQGLRLSQHDDMLHESLKIFDRLFSEFELCYVSAMVNVKTPHEFEAQQLICVLFSESLRRALRFGLLTQEQVDSYDPALMFAVPRLAIVSGLLIYSSGPLSIDKAPGEMSDMFRPFRTLLHKIRSLLWTLDKRELMALEKLLCSNEEFSTLASLRLPDVEEMSDDPSCQYPDIGEFASKFYDDHIHCRDLYAQQSSNEPINESDYLPDNIEVMTPILDGLRRLSEGTVYTEPRATQLENEETKTNEVHQQNSTENNTDTFQKDKDYIDTRVRKPSRAESSDLSSLRNLSTNGLMMFDPLVINAASASTSDTNRQLPDHDLVTSLNEQVTEIADRLSSIVTNDVDLIDHSQIHSFSAQDMPTLISAESNEAYGFTGPKNEQCSCMPSTSHGYLIPNAISQEPVVLSLSQNNSAVFNAESESNDGTNNTDLPLIIPDNITLDVVNTNISIANANLSCILLTNDELRENFVNNEEGVENTSYHSANIMCKDEDKVKFMLGYESDHESPGDSGVSTENTSLDRSPDTDQNKDLKENFMKQNRVLTTQEESDKEKNTLESSFSDGNNVTVNINYIENESQKNEAGTSSHAIESSDEETEPEPPSPLHDISESRRVLQEWGINATEEDHRNIDRVITELRRTRGPDRKLNVANSAGNNNLDSRPSQSSSRQKKTRSSKSKSKKKKTKMWSPGCVILDSRSQNLSPLRLNLDHFVDESGTSCVSDCADDEQIALALQAQELAARQQARGKFQSSEDLIHRLFVCIAGVADQLQTNFAADLRNILKSVFVMNQTPDPPESPDPPPDETPEKSPTIEYEATEDQVIQNGSSFDSVYSAEEVYADNTSDSNSTPSENNSRLVRRNTVNSTTMDQEAAVNRRKSVDNTSNLQASVSAGDLSCNGGNGVGASEADNVGSVERAPEWVPDIAAPHCMRCSAHFTAFRRRHHCRNCGKVFCASCSSNSIPLPRYGQMKPVRVCEECFRSIANNCRRPQNVSQNR